MLRCNNLRYIYRNSGEGLRNLSVTMQPGHFYGLLGKNGAGKTTFLRIISSLLFSQEGTCTISDVPARDRNAKILQDLYVFPEDIYLLSLSGKQFTDYYSPFYPTFDKDYFQSLITELDILDTHNRSLNKVSLGQRKKLYIAFALATKTKILLLDEPINGLDIPSRTTLKNIIYNNAVQNNQIVLVSTHTIKDIENLVDSYIFIDKGEFLFNVTVKDIFSNFSLTFHQTDPPPEALCTIQAMGGYASIVEKKTDVEKKTEEATKFDLEIFFTMVWSSPLLSKKIAILQNSDIETA